MTAPTQLSHHVSPPDELTARIDSQDESFVLPVRQFLETHGCVIATSPQHGKIPHYHIVAGDVFFVKKFFSQSPHRQTKRLAIVWTNEGGAGEKNFNEWSAKIVFVPPKELGVRDLGEIFGHFFTGTTPILDLRPPEMKNQKISLPPKPPTTQREDEERIAKTMAAVFAPQKHAPQKHQCARTVLFFFFVVMLPLFWYTISASVSIAALGTSGELFLQGKQTIAAKLNQVAVYWIVQGKGTLRFIGAPLIFFGGEKYVRQQERLWSLVDNLSQGQEGVDRIITQGQATANILLSDQTSNTQTTSPASSIERIRNDLFFVQNNFGLAQAQLATLINEQSFPFFIPPVKKMGERAYKQLSALRNNAIAVDNLLSLYQKTGGFKEKKTYLVLLQNSMELRPTGGFIGSIGLMTFSEGKLTDLQIQDVYTADGQLKGHVDPPKPIAELLGQEHWYLRDSNWDPDFAASGAKAAWFYEKETGNTVDGVIAINVPMIAELLWATGPITLTDYNDRITAENFFGKSLYYTKNGFFPGSTQKKDFLGTLTTSLIAKLTTEKNINAFGVFRAITNGLARRDILFFFTDTQLQRRVSQLGWAGTIPAKEACDEQTQTGCLFDYFYPVDANLSVNKVNYFVQQEMVHAITIAENGSSQETVTLSYKNTSRGDMEGGGVYRNFARFFIPVDSILTSITIDGEIIHTKQATKSATPAQPPYTTTEGTRLNLSLVGLVFDVPPGGEKRVVISYQRRTPLVFGPQGGMLEVYHQKQPGTSATPLQTVITYPIFWTSKEENLTIPKLHATRGKQVFLAKEAQLLYNTNLSQDGDIKIKFLK